MFNNNAKQHVLKTSRFKENIKNYISGKDVITGKNI
ncbi:cyclomaltodextrinase C-terminal domain-containing protein [Flavobacterium cheongpyeongense]